MTTTNALRWIARTALLAAALAAAACRSAPISIYQQRLESFVAEERNGDLDSIRTASDNADRFDVLWVGGGGIPLITMTRTDAHGLILDTQQIAGRQWYVLIVGVVHYTGPYEMVPLDDASVNEIHLVAVTADGSHRLDWLVGESDPESLKAYRAAQLADDPKASTGFPTDADQWTLQRVAGQLRATEAHSGAVWSLEIPAELAQAR